MDVEWLKDGRKIPDDVMFYIRVMAVHAVRVLGESPEVVAKVYHFNRSCIYRWLRHYDAGGYSALASDLPPGAEPLVTGEMDAWMKATVLNQTPMDWRYDTPLWTCAILAEVLKQQFGVTVSESAIRLHLKRLGLTPQRPEYQDAARDDREVAFFLNEKFPRIQRLAAKMGADIGFEDESGFGVMTRHGTTWGEAGATPVVKSSMKRGGCNVLSWITPEGELRYSLQDGTITGEIFVAFLKHAIKGRERPLILMVDHATFHRSQVVRQFVNAHRSQLRIFFLPKRAPEYNPDEQVWNDLKVNHLGKQPVKDKVDLKQRLRSLLGSLQKNTQRVLSFFQLPDTKYAAHTVACES